MATRYGKKDKWKPVNAPDWVQPEDSNGQDNVPEADIEPAVVTEKVPKKEERGESYTFSVGHDANGAPSSREERKEKRAQRKADKATAEQAPAPGIKQPVADNVRPIGSPDWVPSEESAGTQAVPVADKYHEVHTFGKADPEDMPSAKDIKAQERDARKAEREARKAEREASRSDRPAEAVQDASGTAPEQSATPGPKAAETAQEQPASKPAVTVDENAGEGQPKAAVQAQQEKKDGAEPEGEGELNFNDKPNPTLDKSAKVSQAASAAAPAASVAPSATPAEPVVDPAENTYDSILSQWEKFYQDRVNKETADDETKSRRDYNAQVWGGITEVAANIANLFGTAAGAASQPIQSQQDTWYSRAQAARQEREARRERYASQLQTLQLQKEQLKYNRDITLAQQQRDAAQKAWQQQMDVANYNLKVAEMQGKEQTEAQKLAWQKEKDIKDLEIKRIRANRPVSDNSATTKEEKALDRQAAHDKAVADAYAKTVQHFRETNFRDPTPEEAQAHFELMYPSYAAERKQQQQQNGGGSFASVFGNN